MIRTALLAVAVLTSFVSGRALAAIVVPVQMQCDKTETMVKYLEQDYKVNLGQQGVNAAGQLVQLWVDKAGKFSVIIVTPNGYACYLAGGTDWDKLPVTFKGRDL